MPPKRAPIALSSPNAAKKAPRPAAKKASRPAAAIKKRQTIVQPVVATNVSDKVTKRLWDLLRNRSVDARSIVAFIVGPTCGLESRHKNVSFFSHDNDSTPFLVAVHTNRLDVIQLLLLEYSPDINAMSANRQTALHYAAANNNVEMAKCLLQHNSRLIDALDGSDNTPLFEAVMHNHFNMSQFLLEMGANPHISNKRQQTLIHVCDALNVAKALLANDVNIDAVDHENHTPLHYVLDDDRQDLALLFLEYGANPNIRGQNERTSLHFACKEGMVDMANELLANGAIIDAVDSKGKTPLDYAIDAHHRETVILLNGVI